MYWGRDSDGQLGNGDDGGTDQHGPITVPGISNVTMVAGGSYHTCAMVADGGIKCWGYGGEGQLGNGGTASASSPVDVVGF